MILVDANVWLYYIDEGFQEHEAVRKAFPRLLEDEEILIPAIVQLEVIHHLARKLGERAEETIDTFLAHPGELTAVTAGTVSEAARLLLTHRGEGIGGRDAALLSIAKSEGATIATADKALTRVAKSLRIEIVNPAK